MLADVLVECLAFHPVHQQYGELRFVGVARINKQFLVQILDRSEEGAADVLQLLGYLTVGLGAPLLFLQETLYGVELARLFVLHLKDNSEVSTRHHRLPIIAQYRAKLLQLLKVVLCCLYGLDIFRYQRVVHKPILIWKAQRYNFFQKNKTFCPKPSFRKPCGEKIFGEKRKKRLSL